MRYNDGKDMYTENEMRGRIRRLTPSIVLRNGFDILVTHAPAYGIGDLDDLPHQGFRCFHELINRFSPAYMLYGHVHKNYGHAGNCVYEGVRQEKDFYIHPSGTRIINTYDHYTLTVTQNEYPLKGKTGSPLYDLYISLKER